MEVNKMFKGKNAITICADKKYAADIQSVIDKDIKEILSKNNEYLSVYVHN